jgi:hypothetical protein
MDPAIGAVVGLRRESATDQLDIPPAWMAADSGLPAGSQLPDAPFDKLGGVFAEVLAQARQVVNLLRRQPRRPSAFLHRHGEGSLQ